VFMSKERNELYEFGPFRVDRRECLLTRDGQTIAVTPKAFDTLVALLQNSGHLMLKDELMLTLWPDSFVEEVNLSQNISTLRRVLGDTAQDSRYIVTVPGKGYRFVAEVKTIAPARQETAPPAALPPGKEELVVERHSSARVLVEESGPRHILAMATTAIVVVLIAGYAGYRVRHRQDAPASSSFAAAMVKPRRSVAVLEMRNLSGRSDPAWLSTAFSEMLITELAAGDQLRLISSEEIAQVKTNLSLPNTGSLSPNTLARIRQDLGADLVVVGAYSDLGKQSAGQVRLDLRLQDAAAGETIATISETGTEAELFQLVSRAGTRLREKLGVPDVSENEAIGTRASMSGNPDAVRLYSEGLARLRLFDVLAARDRLEKAVHLDPAYALAHSALADAWAKLGYDQKSKEEAKQAVELSDRLPRRDRLLIEGRLHEVNGEWDKAVENYRTLFDFFPDNIEYGLRLADSQTQDGKRTDAAATIQALRKLPPPVRDDVRIDLAQEQNKSAMGQYSEARDVAARAVEKARVSGVNLLLARALYRESLAMNNEGQHGQAPAVAEQAKGIYAWAGDQFGAAAALAVISSAHWYHGDYAASERVIRQALSINRGIGNKGGVAFDLEYVASARAAQHDSKGAERAYREALQIFREIGQRNGSAYALNGVAWTLQDDGELAASLSAYQQVLAAFHDLSDTDGQARTLNSICSVAVTMGELDKAQQDCEQALALSRANGYKNIAAVALFYLGDIAGLRGNLEQSRKAFSDALALDRETQDNRDAVHNLLALAELDQEEGHSSEAEKKIQEAMAEVPIQDPSNEIHAESLKAEIWLSQGKTAEARREIGAAAATVGQTRNLISRFLYRIAEANVQAGTGDLAAARISLNQVIAEATRRGFVHYELEARLALCVIERKLDPAAFGTRSLALEREARAKGFYLIARKAKAGNNRSS
jgi:DNA-binding winged helix-turn-helix (wHTH) protein/tetratricopeptide (TPR) repeat protein